MNFNISKQRMIFSILAVLVTGAMSQAADITRVDCYPTNLKSNSMFAQFQLVNSGQYANLVILNVPLDETSTRSYEGYCEPLANYIGANRTVLSCVVKLNTPVTTSSSGYRVDLMETNSSNYFAIARGLQPGGQATTLTDCRVMR